MNCGTAPFIYLQAVQVQAVIDWLANVFQGRHFTVDIFARSHNSLPAADGGSLVSQKLFYKRLVETKII